MRCFVRLFFFFVCLLVLTSFLIPTPYSILPYPGQDLKRQHSVEDSPPPVPPPPIRNPAGQLAASAARCPHGLLYRVISLMGHKL